MRDSENQRRVETSMTWDGHFKLGLFPPNQRGGMVPTWAPERWPGTWERNRALIRACDAAGVDFILPASRWIGFGGEKIRYLSETLETMTWASAALAISKHITIFSTVYAPVFHPILAAQQMATADQIGEGRFALNLVCGWRQDEFEMFDTDPDWHETRYDRAQEWIDLVRGVWSNEDPFDFTGTYYTALAAQGHPKPYGGGQPLVMNAGFSPPGRRFAASSCDFLFTNVFDVDEAATRELVEFKKLAAGFGRRDTQVCVTACIVCRDTQAEAEEFVHHYAVDHADQAAIDGMIRQMGMKIPPERMEGWRARMARSAGQTLIVGDPDQVADRIAQYAEAGYSGAAVGMVNYYDELPYLTEKVIPRLEAKGVRKPTLADRAVSV